MKLLFDQNISFRVIKKIEDVYPEANQVRQLNLENCSDMEVWQFAKENDFSIVTFDADFYDLANLKGHPPKIIWLRIGNTSTSKIVQILIDKFVSITYFVENKENEWLACLELK